MSQVTYYNANDLTPLAAWNTVSRLIAEDILGYQDTSNCLNKQDVSRLTNLVQRGLMPDDSIDAKFDQDGFSYRLSLHCVPSEKTGVYGRISIKCSILDCVIPKYTALENAAKQASLFANVVKLAQVLEDKYCQ